MQNYFQLMVFLYLRTYQQPSVIQSVKRNAGTMKLPPVTGRESGDISPIFSRMEMDRVMG